MAAPPQGWSFVAFQPASQPACPAGFGSPTTLEQAPPGNGQCTCACGAPVSNPCAQQQMNLPIRLGTGSACNTGKQADLQGTGPCFTFSQSGGGAFPWGMVQLSPPQHVSCSATGTPSALSPTTGRSCAVVPAPGCAATETCVAPLPSGELCIQSTGDVVCPVLESTRYVVYAPSDVADARTCDDCSKQCQSSASNCTGTLSVYPAAGCTGQAVTLPANNACAMVQGGEIDLDQSATLTLLPDTMACQGPSQAPVTGTITTSNPITVCCM